MQFTSPSCENVLLGKRFFPCRVVQISEMLLADCVHTASLHSFNLFAIGCFQWAKYCDVTGLELVGGVRGHTAQDDVVFEEKTLKSRESRAFRSRPISASVVSC